MANNQVPRIRFVIQLLILAYFSFLAGLTCEASRVLSQ